MQSTFEDRFKFAKALVERFEAKTVADYIAQNFEASHIVNYIQECCTKDGREYYSVMNGPDPLPSHGRTRPASRQLSSPLPLHLPFAPTPMLPPSPTMTASSGYSMPRKPPAQTIIAINKTCDEFPLTARKANGPYNWIRADIVYSRLQLATMPCQVAGGILTVQHKDMPGHTLQATEQVQITWRSTGSTRTRYNVFYVVRDLDDVDVLLGDEMVSEQPHVIHGGSPIHHAPTPQRPHQQMNMFQEAPTSTEFHHQSDYYASPTRTPVVGSHRAGPGQFAMNGHENFPNEVLRAFGNQQARHSPASTVHPGNSVPAERPAAGTRTSTPSSAQTRVMFHMGKSRLGGGDIDLSSGELLWGNIQRLANRGRKKIDRTTHYLRFTVDPEVDNAESCLQDLTESALLDDWQVTVQWIQENRRSEPPHIYGMIEKECPD